MAKIKCNYCGNKFDDTSQKCPHCGAPNDQIARSSNKQPKTIEDLKKWYKDHNLPPENVTRFFIGKNVKEKRAFGIYKNDKGDFVVYKNKDNGQRAVRYEGKDEKYAVNEIYQKLREEISNQKNVNKAKKSQNVQQTSRSSYTPYPSRKLSFFEEVGAFLFTLVSHPMIIGLIIVVGIFIAAAFDDSGYYNYNGREYYNYKDNWYYYDDDLNDWYFADDLDSDFYDNYKDYYSGYSYKDDYGSGNFEDSNYYEKSSSSSSSSSSSKYTDDDDWDDDWDNDSSWDSSDSWDSGSTDWDSDW